MTQFPTVSLRDLIRKIEKMGFQRIRQKVSHIRFGHPDDKHSLLIDCGLFQWVLNTRLDQIMVQVVKAIKQAS